jgi:pimeloyl-ACP methyl ester carboxylesterase
VYDDEKRDGYQASNAAQQQTTKTPAAGTMTTGPVRLCYERFGSADDPAVLLIMGLGTQMLGWRDEFCRALADQGFHVIRFDNRDCGLSTRIKPESRHDSVRQAYLKSLVGWPIRAPYLLHDMVADTIALMDELDIRQAHVVGASMGGMIGQIMTASFPHRVQSLTSIMSSSGRRGLKSGRLRALLRLIKAPPSRETEAVVEHMATTMEVIGSLPGVRQSRDAWREQIRRGVQRAYYPAGTARQLLAVLASGSREALLRQISRPTLVIHGAEDPLVPVEHGRDTAALVQAARLEVIEGMGHDLPPSLYPRLIDLISSHAGQAGRAG